MRLRPTLALPLLAAACASGPAAAPWSATLDGPLGGLPDGWTVATTPGETPGTDAAWRITDSIVARSGAASLTLSDPRGNAEHVYNLCVAPSPNYADVDVSVAVRALDGREDQGGGPAWRIEGERDYYVARWNPLEDNFRVYVVTDAERIELDSAQVDAERHDWHTIRVRHVGDTITCWFDGEELLHATDATSRAAGPVGVWTKADARTAFDDLTVRSAD